MKLSERDAAYLWDMLEAARNVRKLIRGFALKDIMDDFRTRLALERSMEIVGEAARRVSEKFRHEHAEIPWQGIIGLRNIIAHEYDHNRLYSVAKGDVPELIRQLEYLTGRKKRR